MNETMNSLYARHLEFGLMILRQAVDARDWDWVDAETTLLHNIPSLINESNLERHKYFWFKEREAYLRWNRTARPEARSKMTIYYTPLWQEMEPVMNEWIRSGNTLTPSH